MASSTMTPKTFPLASVVAYYSQLGPESLKELFGVDGWLVATQGHFLVAVRGDGGAALPEKYKQISDWLSRPLMAPKELALVDLVKFAGRLQEPDVKCRACHGSGRDDDGESQECEHCGARTRTYCSECDGDKWAGLESDSGCVLEQAPINLKYLAFALRCVPPCERVRVDALALSAKKEHAHELALVLDGDGWRIIIMSIRHSGGDLRKFDWAANP